MSIISRRTNNYPNVLSLKDHIDNLFDDFFDDGFSLLANSTNKTSFAPKINLAETKNEYKIDAELPGVNKENIQLNYKDGILTIKAERKEEKEEKEKNYHRKESFFGFFQRSIHLPSLIKEDEIKAEFKDGILKIELPKTTQSSQKFIEIK